MNGVASYAVAGVLVIDPSGPVFSLLRSTNLGVPLWRVTTSSNLELADIGLVALAVYERPDWDMITELSDRASTVIIAANATHEDACRAVSSGAFGYIDMHLSQDAIRRSMLGAMRGEHAFSRRVLADLIRNGHWLRATNALPLTPRQREVILLIAKGAADKEIAQRLGISTATAQKHVTNLLHRLNVPNRAAAVAVMSASYPL
ncbi:MAG: hypothetical protein AUH85_17360 [Chloroflexi bacterium 13_1_40CM_4_68_4]|nr:MAG: hypothetical protein AUH85_17360 [Chloroflexi bacterium 13_1_40CM_4_68_4]